MFVFIKIKINRKDKMKTKIDELVEAIKSTNSDTEQHREQHKCLWNAIKENKTDIALINDELHSHIPTKKGISYQLSEVQQAVLDIKKIVNIGIGVAIAFQLLPFLQNLLKVLS